VSARYQVSKDGVAVLELVDAPGTLTSTAARPRGTRPVTHPFVTAHALDGFHEDELGRLLRAADSIGGFLSALRSAGYEVHPR
jgi:hypothetical protein